MSADVVFSVKRLIKWSCLAAFLTGPAALADTLHVPAEYPTVQAALDVAVSGDEILLADGTYSGPGNRGLTFNGKAITLRSAGGAAACILDCGNADRGILFDGGESRGAVVQGITVFRADAYLSFGGGIRITEGCHPVIEDCVFLECDGYTAGGGIHIAEGSVPLIRNCVFDACYGYRGGGVWCGEAEAVIRDCTFIRNRASMAGGGFHGTGIVFNCTFADNQVSVSSSALGGGACLEGGSPGTAVNCLFTGNDSAFNGGGLAVLGGGAVINCTFDGNTAGGAGGALFTDAATGLPMVTNCICWVNSPDELDWTGPPPNITFSDVCLDTGIYPGTGNINVDPGYLAYYLPQVQAGQSVDSPCLDAGSANAVEICVDLDTERVCLDRYTTRTDDVCDSGTVDMGYHHVSAIVPSPTPSPSPTPECDELGCKIYMPATMYRAGDTCFCTVTLCNPGPDTYPDTPVFVLLDLFGTYFFAPSFTEFDRFMRDVEPGRQTFAVLPTFTWPASAGSADGVRWYAALTNPECTAVMGEMDVFAFGWEY